MLICEWFVYYGEIKDKLVLTVENIINNEYIRGRADRLFWRIYLSGGVYDGANSIENHFGSSNGGRSLIGRIGLRKICRGGKAGTRFQSRNGKVLRVGGEATYPPFYSKTNMDTMSDSKWILLRR